MDGSIYSLGNNSKAEMVVMVSHNAMSTFLFIILVGWLVSLLPIFGGQAPLDPIIDTAEEAQTNMVNAASGLNQTSGTYESITSVFSIIWNIIVMVITFIAGIFISMATFITVMLGLPVILSGVIIVVISVGMIFSLIKIIIPDR